MRLMIIGALNGQIGAASQIAIARGAKVAHADDIEAVLRNGGGADIIMIDCNDDIGTLVCSLATERINVPVVACGIGNDAKAAVRAIKAGAQEYITLPPDEEMIAAVLEAVTEDSHAIIHADPKMTAVLELAKKVAVSVASIMVIGGSGTGKELIAHYIHRHSARSKAPFVAVNCAAIPENLLESELFGYEKGAFTGAVSRRIGKFEEAHGGTLLLDEISEMDPRLQAKLLRAIQEREIDRIGGKKPIKVDVRVIATSNRDMQQEVAKGNFREDLYFRINVVTVQLPSLRDRPGDIEPLTQYFVDKYVEANGLDTVVVAPDAMEALKAHDWPGNVRELENTIHRGVLLAANGKLTLEAVQLNGGHSGSGATASTGASPTGSGIAPSSMVGMTVAEVERDLIIDTLDHCLGNRTHSATILGISIRTLRNKLHQYTDQGRAGG
ncbi:MAG: sigma-54 dependent transcriptional regulator [Proteobacteria bacterium]|nr:sigma-54 dependent transcriptional regulator [Pseudomonadota bacterium]